ncbi:MAG: hypothetical protein AABY18_08850 [Candidatus Thermoplasmatota archaeon]
MNAALTAVLIAALLAGAGATVAVVSTATDGSILSAMDSHSGHDHGAAGADEHKLHGGEAGDHAHDQIGMQRPRFPAAAGTVPTPEAAESLEEVSFLELQGDKGFNPANGVRSGVGTLEDPYVISGYYVTGDLYLGDTDACFEVKENFIAGQLSLNWNGQCAWVHHNFIRDLRVNENIARTGYATGGLIEANEIEFIGQLRHYDGELRDNVVGPRTSDSAFDEVLEETPLLAPDLLLANVDGFNQGLIHHNTFYGPVDLDLHGHHHGTGFFAPHSHYHALDGNHTPDHEEDHTDRWTSVAFTDNKIVDDVAYGLRYEDENHAGDDRTATSEDNEMLEESHIHHTDVMIARNVIDGGQVWVDVFNADDENHEERNPGWLSVIDNAITMKEREDKGILGLGIPMPFVTTEPYVPNVAILVQATKEFEATIAGNTMTFVPLASQQTQDPLAPLGLTGFFGPPKEEPTAILLEGVKDANITLENNQASGFYYGVRARDMDDKVFWSLAGNAFGDAQHDVYYDDTVANKPTEG